MIRGFLEESPGGTEPCIREYIVDPAEGFQRGRGHPLDLIPLGNVAAHDKGSFRPAEGGGQFLQRFDPPACEDQFPSARHEAGRRAPDSAAGTGDQKHLFFAHAGILAGGRHRSPGPAIIGPEMDVQRKRQVRLFVALGAALLLATGLIYTSFNASSEARKPSELSDAVPGKSYEMTGRVVKDSIVKTGQGIRFAVKDRDGTGQALPVTYSGVVPDPFREGREIVIKGTVEDGVFVGERDTLVTKCPSKFSEKQNQ